MDSRTSHRTTATPLSRRTFLHVAGVAAASLGGGLLAACGPGTPAAAPAPAKPTPAPTSAAAPAPAGSKPAAFSGTLEFFGWTFAPDLVKKRVDAFTQATGIKVSYSNGPFAQFHDALVTKFAGNAPLDVVYGSDHWLPEFVEAGWVAPLDGFPNVELYKKDMLDSAVQAMTYKGKTYGLPYYTDVMALLYNEEHLQKAGFTSPPKTWDELMDQAKKIKAAKIAEYPVLFNLANESWLTEYVYAQVYSRGGDLFDSDNQPVFDKPDSAAADALNWLRRAIYEEKVLSPASVETGELAGLKAMQGGQGTFTMLGKYRLFALNDPKQSQIAGKAKQALMPSGMAGKGQTVAWTRLFHVTASAAKSRDRADAAYKLVEWFGGKDSSGTYATAKAFLLEGGPSFAAKPLYQDPQVQKFFAGWGDPATMEKQAQLSRAKSGMQATWFNEWDTFNKTVWQKALLRQEETVAALRASADKWRGLKKQAG